MNDIYQALTSHLLQNLINTHYVLKATFAYVIFFKDALFRMLLVPIVLFVFGNFILHLLGTFALAIYIFNLFMLCKIALITHRVLLIGNDIVVPYGIEKFHKRDVYFLGVNIAYVLVVTILPFSLFLLIFDITQSEVFSEIANFVGLFLAYYLLARLSLLLPSISIDKGMSIKQAWQLSSKHQLLLILLTEVIPYLFLFIVSWALYLLNLELLIKGVYPILAILIIAMLSVSYKFIEEQEEQKVP